jgi:protein-disulfide isomerase
VTELALILRLALAVVLAAAALPKLADRARTADGLRGFGVPARLAAPGAIALPLAELVIAGALLLGPAGPALAAAAALALLFTAAQLANLARGRRPACRCFGAGAPIGAATVARAAALGLAAVAALAAGPGPGAAAWVGDLAPAGRVAVGSGLALAAVAAAFGWVVLQLLRAQGRMLLRLEALEAAEPEYTPVAPAPSRRAPHFTLPALAGGTGTLAALLERGRAVVLVFTDSRCAACRSLLPRIAEWQRRDDVTVAVVAAGDPGALRDAGLDQVLLDGGDVADRYGVSGTPSAVLVDATGRIAAPVAAGPVGITALVLRAAELPRAVVAGAPAPDVGPAGVRLPAGGPRLVVFWDETCPACSHAAADLAAWDAALGPDRLLVISRGGRGPAGLRAAVGLDEDDAVTRAFGVRGTPSAVLLDGDGVIAAPVAEGVPAIDVLAGLASAAPEVVA